MMIVPSHLLNADQERELDKVNAFYLQKEEEVRHPHSHTSQFELDTNIP
jgi:hypothetical protein